MDFKEVDCVPSRKKQKNEYVEFLKKFMESGMPIAMVSNIEKGKSPANIAAYLSNVGYKMDINIRIARRGRDIYLINTKLYKGDI